MLIGTEDAVKSKVHGFPKGHHGHLAGPASRRLSRRHGYGLNGPHQNESPQRTVYTNGKTTLSPSSPEMLGITCQQRCAWPGPAGQTPRRNPAFTVLRNFRRPWKTRAFTAATEMPRILVVSAMDLSSMSRSRIVLRIFGPNRLIALVKRSVRSRCQQDSSGLGLRSTNTSFLLVG
jgi:hypothetical protein